MPTFGRRDQVTNEWRIELQNKVRGSYLLTVTWDIPRARTTNTLFQFAGTQALGVERETGFVVFLAKPPLQITEQSATSELVRIDTRELPEWTGLSAAAGESTAEMPVLVYRYLRPAYALTVEAKRFQDAAVLQALADSLGITTVIADDGQMMTELSLAIRNNGLQHLEIELPADAREVWSAFVGGQPVRPAKTGNKLLLPLERSGADDAPVRVELTYTSTAKFPRRKGDVILASPKFGLPLKNARWDLYLPPDHAYGGFEGSMTHQGVEEVRDYSSAAYFQQEEQKKAARRSELAQAVSSARNLLASGKVKGANDDLNRALRLNSFDNGTPQADLEGVKREINRAQGGNLIQAQRKYVMDNGSKYGQQPQAQMLKGGQQRQVQQNVELFVYDNAAAEQQWGALQRAQEITVAQVQPLRVNLPTRGLHHTFAQVLQTEVNKPLTIQFQATNTRVTGWFSRVLYVVGSFIILWIFVSVVLSRFPRQSADIQVREA